MTTEKNERDPFNDKLTFKDIITSHKELYELSYAEIGERVGKSRAYIYDLAVGRKVPSIKQAKEIASLLDLPVNVCVVAAINGLLEKEGIDPSQFKVAAV